MLALALALALVDPGSSGPADDLPLLPLGSVHPPAPVEDEAALPGRCEGKPLQKLVDRLPFGPGEQLQLDIALLGIRTGKVNVRVGERTVMDGASTFPLQAEAKSDEFLDVLGNFDARMVSFFDPAAMVPVRMVNHVVAHQPFVAVPVDSKEDGAFAKGGLNARLRRSSVDGSSDKQAHYASNADLVDILSVVFYLRSHELREGDPFCFEVYHRRKLWHVEGTVGGVEIVRPPLGARAGRRLDAIVTHVGGKEPPRPVTAYLGDDADRFPLLVSTPGKLGDIEVRLLGFKRGRRLVAR